MFMTCIQGYDGTKVIKYFYSVLITYIYTLLLSKPLPAKIRLNPSNPYHQCSIFASFIWNTDDTDNTDKN